ncbi:MAG: YtxH domain-containing protein [Anaerolineae bacterium]
MRRLISLLVGLGLGTTVAVIIVTLFSPFSGEELRENLKEHYQDALEAARKASEAKRQELEQELAEMQKQ